MQQAYENVREFVFKRVESQDLQLLFRWFNQPYIAELWAEPKTWDEFREKWLDKILKDFNYVAYIDGVSIGYIRYYHVNDDDRKNFAGVYIPEPSVGSDLFIGEPEYLGKGYGAEMIRQFIAFVKSQEPNCKAMVIDPASDNLRAIACYEKVGFQKVGTYTMPYGTIHGPGPIELMIYFMDDARD